MKDYTLTLLDTKGDMISNVAMKNNRMFLISIETDVPKFMCER
jgi:tRNA pseudouridine-54 N-methylase